MDRAKLLPWLVISFAIAMTAVMYAWRGADFPPISRVLFWTALLAGAELLPVTLGFKAEVTMAFPIVLAIAILYEPQIAASIVGLGALDIREIRREIPLSQALYNRAQLMITVAVPSLIVHSYDVEPFTFPWGTLLTITAAFTLIITNLGLVIGFLTQVRGVPLAETRATLVPNPTTGFWVAQMMLGGLGIATAAAYGRVDMFVAAFLIPLLFARLGILGARAQEELSERLRKQQEALLVATEQVFNERERERKRIAEEIHDGSLQMLAAASYGVGNASDFLASGKDTEASSLLRTTRKTIDKAMLALRESLVDLRRSSVEAGGLVETIRKYVAQVSSLWGTDVTIEGEIQNEPPIPVALAAFQILQEGLVNSLKHSNSTSITVHISENDRMVHIVVEDQGAGFDPEEEVASDHVGMRLMKERAERVGGRVEMESAVGQGTRLEAVLPAGAAE